MRRVALCILVVLTLLIGVADAVWAAAGISGPTIEEGQNGSELLTFNINSPIQLKKSFALDKPDRIVIDIPRVATGALSLPKDYTGGLIKSIRFGQFDATTSRIVLDLNGPAKVVSTTPGAPLMVEIASTGGGAVKKSVDKKPLVVIDAGHGGQDPGAKGIHGTQEKEVTLNYARALRDALIQSGRYRVLLTRDDDHFIALADRVAIARKAKADIFISFHADSNPKPEARGLSLYTLSETASDAEAAALAERENKSDIIAGIDLNTTDADVASILIDLTQRETMNKSAVLADAVVASLSRKITKLEKTHRFAGFRVLKGPDVPSVLIELGFLSNPTDERLLLTPDYRELVIDSVIKGIDRYRAGE